MSPRPANRDFSRGPRLGELRAIGEFASLPAAIPLLLALAPRGDGHPVLLLPGLGGGDRSTSPLRRYLNRLGYQSSPWKQGTNRGGSGALYQRLTELISQLSIEHGGKVSLVGWSLGGLHALRVAAAQPRLVRNVITLGSPLGDELQSGPPRSHPVSALYSRTDAIVPWQLSRVTEGPRAENLEVYGSHLGLGVNPSVFMAVADRLAQPEGSWKPFERDGWRPFFFPDPDR